MKIADTLLLDFDHIIDNTRRTLEVLPQDLDANWAPHPKSMPVGRLAMHCATICLYGEAICTQDGLDLAKMSSWSQTMLAWKGTQAALDALKNSAAKCRTSLAAISDEAMLKPWRFSMGDHLISEAPRAVTMRSLCMDHLVHHTAQLGVYLRLLNLPIPGLYGPSADGN